MQFPDITTSDLKLQIFFQPLAAIGLVLLFLRLITESGWS